MESLEKFNLNLKGKIVLTEAATGNYVVTAIIAALAGACVYAFTKDSAHGSIKEVKRQTYGLAQKMNVRKRISIIESLSEINLKDIDVVTNTGFLRPVNQEFISQLSSQCVIPLMWEPWEYRKQDLDLEACCQRGIKVYGTNEDDGRLKTKEYIGFVVLYHLLKEKISPFGSNVLLIGCERFVKPVAHILRKNKYETVSATEYPLTVDVREFDAIVILEHERELLIVGDKKVIIDKNVIDKNTLVLHICGNVCFDNAQFKYIPEEPKPFGHMSFTTDYIDDRAVIDLHTAGFKVAEGMLCANELELTGLEYKLFVEKNYPALAFEDQKFW